MWPVAKERTSLFDETVIPLSGSKMNHLLTFTAMYGRLVFTWV